ncbi:MAG: SBBP repeat-containing protein [candidate division WOR-3 bacterium]|nr:SBBP repeat-containing protein [candidate division WOR-3 bacterium]
MTRTVLTAACLFLMGTSMALADDTLWTRYFPGDRDCYGRTLLVDHDDNIIAVGTCLGAGSGNDVGVVKVSPDGTRLWFVTVAGPGAYNDEAKGAALDPDGNIYVTASSGLYPDFDIMTVKLDPTGSEVWSRNWGGPDNKQDVPAGIAVDTAGNSYVTGYTTAANGLTDWVTMKLAPDSGLPLWTVVRLSEGGGFNYPTAIAVGPDGSPYVTGYNQRVHLEDYATVKYNTDGVEQWASFYNYSGNGTDKAADIAVDDAGDAYVTGASATAPPPGGLYQDATVRYANDSGTQMWVTRYTGEGGNNAPAAIALGASAVYVTGSGQRDTGDYYYATIAYDKSSGSELWATRFNGPPGGAVDLAVLPYGMVLVTGTSGSDIMTLRYTEAGVEDWAARYSDAVAAAITFDSHCNPIVLGSSFGSGYYGFLIIKYDSAAVGGVTEFKPAVPGRPGMRLAPNPARNWTNLTQSFSGAVPAIVSLLGVDGRVVRTQRLDGQAGEPSRLDLTGLAPGVYVVRLASGGCSATQKLVIEQ